METYQAKWARKSPFSMYADNYTKTITIKPGPGSYANRMYQREETRMNGVVIYSADYPAGTDYAMQRLEGLTRVTC